MSDVLKMVVDGLWRQGDKSLAVRLVAQNRQPLPGWQPGAHIDVHLPCGIIRQYSLTGAHSDGVCDSYLICVAQDRASRGGSRYIHETLRPGQTLLISPPRNLFALQPAGRVTLLAAGIGITPLYTMALHLHAAGIPFALHYFVKSRDHAAFTTEMMATFGDERCTIHCSDEGGSPRTGLSSTLGEGHADHHLYLCGPAGFMAAARQCATEKTGPRRRSTAKPSSRQRPSPEPTETILSPSLWPPPGKHGQCRAIKLSPRYCRTTAWPSRFRARWACAAPA